MTKKKISIPHNGQAWVPIICMRSQKKYTIIFDHDYQELCPWANVISRGDVWPDDLVDEAVEVFASEKNNREQRRKRREEREKKEKDP